MSGPIVVTIPGARLLSSRSSGNNRLHPHARAKEARTHRQGANAHAAKALGALPGVSMFLEETGVFRPSPSCRPRVRSVTLARLCPARYFCDQDNLRALFKATLDGVADALGVNDKVFTDNPIEARLNTGWIAITYEQIAGDWGVRITIEPAI